MFRALMRRPKAGASTRGMTLIELAVAILILTIGSIAALRAADQSQRVIGGEMPRLLARIAARNYAEQLQLLAPQTTGLPTQVKLGGYSFDITTQTTRTEAGLSQVLITARATSGEGAELVVYLPRVNIR